MKSIFIVFYMIGLSSAVIYRLNDTEHDLMPPLLRLDNYDKCLRKPGGVYCTAVVDYVTDEPSALFTQMQEYSEYTIRHFNYTRAFYGTCLDKCTMETNMDQQHTLEACLNRTVWDEYELKVKVVDKLLCKDDSHRRVPIDGRGMAMIVICLILVTLNVVASIYDVCSSSENHGKAACLLLSFSLRQNWADLVAPPDTKDERISRLQGIHGFRAIVMLLVVLAHAMMVPLIVSDTPMFYEKEYDNLSTHIFMNGSLIMQMFMVISAFLLILFLTYFEEQQEVNWKLLPLAILKRWLRLAPSYAVVLGVTATWFNHIGDGPLWNHLVSAESEDCGQHWWRHVLFVNNYLDGSRCMPHTWYLATDFQLHCLGVFVFCLSRSQTSRKVVLSALFLIGLVLPGLHTYFQDLDAVLIYTPTGAANMFINDPTFNSLYKRTHNNLACFTIGMALGYLVPKLLSNHSKGDTYKKWRTLYWIMCPAAFSVPVLCKIFYGEGPRVDVWWRTAASVIIRPAYGGIISFLLVGTMLKFETVYRGFLEWRGWVVVSRASYSAYLMHPALMRAAAGLHARPFAASYISILESVMVSTLATSTAAVAFNLTVEAPLNKLLRMCLSLNRSPTPTAHKKEKPH